MLGQPMRVRVSQSLTVDLAPFTKDQAQQLIAGDGGIQLHSVTRYMSTRQAFTAEDEASWYDTIRQRKDGITWGIWVMEGDERRLIGNSSFINIKEFPIRQATTASSIIDKSYWGRGIASAIHRARTWYGFSQLDLDRIDSEVVQANIGSRRALEKSGYYVTHTERNRHFADSKLHHIDTLECLSPREDKWSRWWGEDTPSTEATAARIVTSKALQWAEQNVTLL